MKKVASISILVAVFGAQVSFAGAEGIDGQQAVHDRARGELSIGAGAPSQEAMMRVIENGTSTQLGAILEYGERVECHACVAPLEENLYTSSDPYVRELSAWWLRRRPFGFAAVMHGAKQRLAEDASEDVRARAAEAIGEFMDPRGVASLVNAASEDESEHVRAAALHGLARLNHAGVGGALSGALDDDSAEVRAASLDASMRLSIAPEGAALAMRLADDDVHVRRLAAAAAGRFAVEGARAALVTALSDDSDDTVRKSAAWALGTLGAREELRAALETEEQPQVRDAIDIAMRMR